jgi:transglutaminase-like putative cysteine protease
MRVFREDIWTLAGVRGKGMEDLKPYLEATDIIDSNHPDIKSFAEETCDGAMDPVDVAVRLYYAVRDGIRYDPYYPFYRPEHYRASTVLKLGRAFCIPKVSLLCALARACGIPARAGFATVKNHLATRQLLEFLGSDLFVYHGFAELFLEGKWVKATPAFNKELCARHGAAPLEFNGREDSIFHPFTADNKKYMEYVELLGSYADIPVQKIVDGFKRTYGENRVQSWIDGYEKDGDIRSRHFETEEVIKNAGS